MSDDLQLQLPIEVAELLDAMAHWNAGRWREALRAAGNPTHRQRRALSRTICDALLAHEHRQLQEWLARDAARTVAETVPAAWHDGHPARMIELVEDAALAQLARPALPLADLVVLLGPCLPLREPDGRRPSSLASRGTNL